MNKQFNSNAYYGMGKIRAEIEEKLKQVKGNPKMEEIYKNQLKIVNRCVNTLYL